MLRRPKATVTQSLFAVALRCQRNDAVVQQPVAADPEHRAVDIGEDHLSAVADALGEGARQVAAAAGNVEHPAAFPSAALFDGEVLPQPVQPG
jgi:hypothetical protein